MRRATTRASDQSGAISAEYVAAVVVIGLIVAGLVAIGVPGSVRDWGEYAVCQLFASDDECERPSSEDSLAADDEDDTPQPPVCTTSDTSRDQRRTTDWIFSRSIDGERYQMTELSDGTVVIHDTEYEGDGHSAGIGVDIPLGARDKLGLSASGHLTDMEEGGRMFVLSPEAFEEYQDTVGAIARDMYMNGPRYAEMQLGLGASVEEYIENRHALQLRDMAIEQMIEDHVTHDYARTRREISLDLGGSYKGISAGTALSAGAEKVITVDRDTGVSSITAQFDAERASQLGIGVFGVGAGVEGSGKVDAAITVELGPDGEVLTAALSTGFDVSGGGFVGLDPGSIPGDAVDDVQTSAGFGVDASQGGRVQTTYSVDLQGDAHAQQQLTTFLDDPVRGLDDFVDLAGRRGEVLMEAFDVETDSENVDLAVRVLAQAGFSDSDERRVARLAEAVSYDPFNGLLHREDCLQ